MNGYICSDDERNVPRYLAPIGFIIMFLLDIAFWIEVYKNVFIILYWLCAIVWLLYLMWLIVVFYRNRIVADMQFDIEEDVITNLSLQRVVNSVNTSREMFITLFTLEFCYGKATKNRSFYLLWEEPISGEIVKENGLSALRKLSMNGVVILPQTNVIDDWLISKTKLKKIPHYPTVALKASRDTADDSRQGDGSPVPSS